MLNTKTSKIVNISAKLNNCVESYRIDGYKFVAEGGLNTGEYYVLLQNKKRKILIVRANDDKVVDLKIMSHVTSIKGLTREYWNYRIDSIIRQYRENGFFVGVLSRSFEKQVYLCKKANATVYVTLERNIEGSEYKIKEVAKMC